jgi:hypothetical protein
MNLSVTIAPESLASIKAAVMAEAQQPTLFGTNPPVRAVAEEIMEKHGIALVNSIVDTRMDDLAMRIAEQTCKQDIADHIDLSELAGEFSLRAIAEEVNVDASDVAEHIDMSDLAQHLDVDTDDLADRVANNLDLSDIARHVADEVDYETLAEAMNTKALAREIVGQFINNEEFRNTFMDTLLSSLKNSVSQ